MHFSHWKLNDWLSLFWVLFVCVCGFSILGGIIGYFLRGRIVLQICISLFASIAIILISQSAGFASLVDIEWGFVALVAGFPFTVLPAVLMAVAVGHWGIRPKDVG
jgi:hypothetical protein